MKRNKKSVKGMTLVEIIISVLVFSVIALILVQVGSSLNTLIKRANHINTKTSVESPVVENGRSGLNVTFHEFYSNEAKKEGRNEAKDWEEYELLNNNMTAYMDKDSDNIQRALKITIEKDGTPISVAGRCFTASPAIVGKNADDVTGDLKYIYVSKDLKIGANEWKDSNPIKEKEDESD